MKHEGHSFPVLKEADAMFVAESAPEWKDGEVCHRCRVQFSMVVRKHHCRSVWNKGGGREERWIEQWRRILASLHQYVFVINLVDSFVVVIPISHFSEIVVKFSAPSVHPKPVHSLGMGLKERSESAMSVSTRSLRPRGHLAKTKTVSPFYSCSLLYPCCCFWLLSVLLFL